MTKSRIARTVAVLAALTLVAGAFAAAPAEAKKKKKKKAVPACAPYDGGIHGADAETTVVTDAATEDAPIEVAISTEPGVGLTNPDDPSGDQGHTAHAFHNVQVDSAAAGAGLYVRIEYLPSWDYDLFLRAPEGPSVAYEADFNPLTANGPTPVGGNEGAHPEPGAGQVDGYLAEDCSGYTVDIASAVTPGGEVTLLMWLGEPGS